MRYERVQIPLPFEHLGAERDNFFIDPAQIHRQSSHSAVVFTHAVL